jgi:hypothetical protein
MVKLLGYTLIVVYPKWWLSWPCECGSADNWSDNIVLKGGRGGMDYDRNKVDEMVLALLTLTMMKDFTS